MSTHEAQSQPHAVGSTRLFVTVWIWLVAITALEVYLGYIQLRPAVMLTLLVGLSLVKAVLIVAYFMHLRYERLSLTLVLIPSVIFCILLIVIFFLPDSLRLLQAGAG